LSAKIYDGILLGETENELRDGSKLQLGGVFGSGLQL